MSARRLKLLTIGHSYVVALNRRLPNEIARLAAGCWDVTAVAPRFVRAELRDIELEADPNESSQVEAVNMYATRRLHLMAFDFRLRQILRQGWDMVHIYQEPYILAGWQAAYWTPEKVPFVFFTAQNYAKNYPPPFSWMEKYCVERCAGWIACGELVVRALLEKNYGRRRHRQIGFGVDIELFRPDELRRRHVRQRLGWDEKGCVVCFLGRLTPEKGLPLLVSVLDQLRCPWKALFVGSGPLQKSLEEWGRRYPGRVRIISATHDEVPAYLNAADILCAPSQTLPHASEQFGRMIIEGFASGLPVVGSDSGEIPYVIGDAGIVLGEKDHSAWSLTLERLINDETLRGDLATRGRVRAEDHFAWPVIARQHLEFFDELRRES